MHRPKKIKFLRKFYDYFFAKYKYRGLCTVRSLQWLVESRERVLHKNKNIEDFLPEELRGEYDKDFLREVFLISTESSFDQATERPKDDDIFYMERSEFFKNEQTVALLAEGYNRMQSSIDPAHGWAHVRRTLRFADILWRGLPEAERPDWGAVLIAVVWHDVARVDRLGPADDYWPWLKKVPMGQDFSIILTAVRDAPRSANMLRLACRRHNLPKKLRKLVVHAIGKTSNLEVRKGKKSYLRKNFLVSEIVHDADILDLITVARIDDIFQKAKDTDFIDPKFYDRFLAIFFFFGISMIQKRFLVPHARGLYDLIVGFSDYYSSLFYPEMRDSFKEVIKID